MQQATQQPTVSLCSHGSTNNAHTWQGRRGLAAARLTAQLYSTQVQLAQANAALAAAGLPTQSVEYLDYPMTNGSSRPGTSASNISDRIPASAYPLASPSLPRLDTAMASPAAATNTPSSQYRQSVGQTPTWGGEEENAQDEGDVIDGEDAEV